MKGSNSEDLGSAIKETRIQKGITQAELAKMTGISRSALAKYEVGTRKVPEEITTKLLDALLKIEDHSCLEAIFDYLTIHFFSTDYEKLVKKILGVSMKHMIFSESSTLGYTGRFNLLQAIDIRTSDNMTKGTLIELKGKGCRFLTGWLRSRNQTWTQFIQTVFEYGGNFTRIDLSINDYEGLLDIPDLAEKVNNNFFESIFKRGDIYKGKNLANGDSDGTTIYFGSPKSQVRYCFYQKNYEQRRKKRITLEESSIINRYELRFRHEKAQELAAQLLITNDLKTIIFELINHSICFYDRLPNNPKAKIDKKWSQFIGNHGKLAISIESKPMSLEKSIHWLVQSVSPTMKLVSLVGKVYGLDLLEMIISTGELSEKTQQILDVIEENPEWFKEEIQIYHQELFEKQKKQSTAHTS